MAWSGMVWHGQYNSKKGEIMRDATMAAVLQINASYEPMAFCTTRRAFILLVKGKAVVVEERDREIRRGMMAPSVIRLRNYVNVPHKTQVLSRKNILLRDRCRCQYCGVTLNAAHLTLDHVIPKSLGGRNEWHNLVACCAPCNRKKSNKTLEECGLTLIRKPRPVTVHTSRHVLRSVGAEDPKWRRYLYFDSEGDSHRVTQG
jgi:5-methylcytosine-specific restriction endonuclease McrA